MADIEEITIICITIAAVNCYLWQGCEYDSGTEHAKVLNMP